MARKRKKIMKRFNSSFENCDGEEEEEDYEEI